MGVSCVGKTTVASRLASELNATFLDADHFHSNANILKMNKGIPLSDDDRKPWLLKLNSELIKKNRGGDTAVLACSALKEAYRQLLLKNIAEYLIIYLHAEEDLLKKRFAERNNHFFNPILLSSQMRTLEVPQKKYIEVNANNQLDSLIRDVLNKILSIDNHQRGIQK